MTRRTFTLRDLLALTACFAVLFAIGTSLISRWREQQRQNECLLKLRGIGIAAENLESATKRYPLVSDAPASLAIVAPGSFGHDSSAGYSWAARIIPYYCQNIWYKELRKASNSFGQPPFDPSVRDPNGIHYATHEFASYFTCPTTTPDTRISNSVRSEYDSLRLPGGRPAATSYVAIVGTHVDAARQVVENGVIVSRCMDDPACQAKGLRIRDIGDGISNTLLACESRESTYAAWIDGQATWVVGINPDGAGNVNADLGFPGGTKHLIGAGGDPAAGNTPYSTLAFGNAQGWPGMSPRLWGPSSGHAGGVGHVFADGHAKFVQPSMDPTIYYFLITRNSGDPACCAEDLSE